MARYRRGDQIEERLSDRLQVGGSVYTVDLIAKRATGVEGYRMTLSYIEAEGTDSRFVRLEPAHSREDVEQRARELAGDRDRLATLLREDRT